MCRIFGRDNLVFLPGIFFVKDLSLPDQFAFYTRHVSFKLLFASLTHPISTLTPRDNGIRLSGRPADRIGVGDLIL